MQAERVLAASIRQPVATACPTGAADRPAEAVADPPVEEAAADPPVEEVAEDPPVEEVAADRPVEEAAADRPA